ncbi:hypothetical protein JB92DRAFT_2892486, partial [Gautieria morchelliformis]
TCLSGGTILSYLAASPSFLVPTCASRCLAQSVCIFLALPPSLSPVRIPARLLGFFPLGFLLPSAAIRSFLPPSTPCTTRLPLFPYILVPYTSLKTFSPVATSL